MDNMLTGSPLPPQRRQKRKRRDAAALSSATAKYLHAAPTDAADALLCAPMDVLLDRFFAKTHAEVAEWHRKNLGYADMRLEEDLLFHEDRTWLPNHGLGYVIFQPVSPVDRPWVLQFENCTDVAVLLVSPAVEILTWCSEDAEDVPLSPRVDVIQSKHTEHATSVFKLCGRLTISFQAKMPEPPPTASARALVILMAPLAQTCITRAPHVTTASRPHPRPLLTPLLCVREEERTASPLQYAQSPHYLYSDADVLVQATATRQPKKNYSYVAKVQQWKARVEQLSVTRNALTGDIAFGACYIYIPPPAAEADRAIIYTLTASLLATVIPLDETGTQWHALVIAPSPVDANHPLIRADATAAVRTRVLSAAWVKTLYDNWGDKHAHFGRAHRYGGKSPMPYVLLTTLDDFSAVNDTDTLLFAVS